MASAHAPSIARVKGLVKGLIKTAFDKTVIQLIFYIRRRTLGTGLYSVLYERAILTSAAYIEEKLGEALFFEDKKQLWNFAFKKIKYDGLFAEFGVFKGRSINHFANKLQNKNITIYG